NRKTLLDKLTQFLAIPSVSTDSEHAKDVQEAANYVEHYLEVIGFPIVEQIKTDGHPIVYAEYNEAGSDAPTVLFYGHYDVQPVDPIEEWESKPFHAEVR